LYKNKERLGISIRAPDLNQDNSTVVPNIVKHNDSGNPFLGAKIECIFNKIIGVCTRVVTKFHNENMSRINNMNLLEECSSINPCFLLDSVYIIRNKYYIQVKLYQARCRMESVRFEISYLGNVTKN